LRAGEENVIALTRRSIATVRVVDAQTGKPAEQVRLVMARVEKDRLTGWSDFAGWEETYVHKVSEGVFELYDVDGAYKVRAMGKGTADWEVEESGKIVSEGKDHEVVLEMRHGERLTGELLDENGVGLGKTGVRISTVWVDVYEGQLGTTEWLRKHDPDRLAITDEKGRFSFPPQLGDFLLMVETEKGYAIASAKEFRGRGVLQLLEWGKLKGVAMKDGKAAAGVRVSADMAGLGRSDLGPGLHYSAMTDGEGRFEFPRVIADEYVIEGRQVMVRAGGEEEVVVEGR
jgi:hypothetical protein